MDTNKNDNTYNEIMVSVDCCFECPNQYGKRLDVYPWSIPFCRLLKKDLNPIGYKFLIDKGCPVKCGAVAKNI